MSIIGIALSQREIELKKRLEELQAQREDLRDSISRKQNLKRIVEIDIKNVEESLKMAGVE